MPFNVFCLFNFVGLCCILVMTMPEALALHELILINNTKRIYRITFNICHGIRLGNSFVTYENYNYALGSYTKRMSARTITIFIIN